MAETVLKENEISLNAVRYKTTGPVQATLVSQYPPKIIIGDTSKDTHQRLSVLTLNDWRGGVGLNRIIKGEGLDRTDGANTCQTLYKAGAFLPFARGAVSGGITGKININELAGTIYAVFGADVRSVNSSTAALSSSLDTLPGTTPTVTDSINFVLGSTEYLAWATYDSTGGAYGYTYTSNGSAFTDDAKDVEYFTFWDNRLWGIDHTGQLWFSTVIGTETDDAKLPLPADEVTALFTGPDATGQEIIYAATQRGLYAHDAANAMFHKTGVTYPRQTNGGLSSRTWNGDIYVPVGLGVLKYTPQTGRVENVGLDQDDGLPLALTPYFIEKLIPTNTLLFAEIQGALSIYIYAFNGRGWGYFYSAVVPTSGGNSYSSSVGAYRLWVPQSTRVEYVRIPVAGFNPEQDTTLLYQTSGNLLTPWFDADQLEVDKLAIRLLVETVDPAATETVTMSSQVDQDADYTARGSAITTSGITTITLPGNVSTDVGLAFKRIRFRAALAKATTTTGTHTGGNNEATVLTDSAASFVTAGVKVGYTVSNATDGSSGTITAVAATTLTCSAGLTGGTDNDWDTSDAYSISLRNTPIVKSIILEYRKKISDKWGFLLELDLANDYNGKSVKEQRAALLTAIQSNTLLEFTYQDTDGTGKTYYVDVLGHEGVGVTGVSERGQVRLALSEV